MQNNKVIAIRDRVSSQTESLVRAYGARRAMSGSGFSRPPIYGF